MTRPPKSPPEKKDLALRKDHFTFAENVHGFRKQWKKNKQIANRTYRRRSDELLAQTKTSQSANDVEVIAGDVTSKRIQDSVSKKRLRKTNTVRLSEKIYIKLAKREKTIGRKVNQQRKYDVLVRSAVERLVELEDEALIATVKRIEQVLRGGDPMEWMRLSQSSDPIDQAVFFVERVNRGDGFYAAALRRDQRLCDAFQLWAKQANSILAKLRAPAERKLKEQTATEKKIKTLRREAQSK